MARTNERVNLPGYKMKAGVVQNILGFKPRYKYWHVMVGVVCVVLGGFAIYSIVDAITGISENHSIPAPLNRQVSSFVC